MESDDTKLTQDVAGTRADSTSPPLCMKTEDSSQNDIFARHHRLVGWVLTNNGYFHPDAQIAFSSRKGFHALVANGKTISSGTRIAACPMPLTISILNALDVKPFSCHGTHFPKPFLVDQASKAESLQSFFLMEQLVLGDKSWWAPYISSLPTVEDVNELQFSEDSDLAWLEGTNLKGGYESQLNKWQQMYQHGLELLKRYQWPHAHDETYTWEAFRWAATIFGSRSFTSQVLDDTLPADQARLGHRNKKDGPYDLVKLFTDRFGVLLPLLDILNHKPGVQVEWLARFSFVGLQVLQPYESGQELCNNYGPKDNEGLLLSYGFTFQDNPFDHLVISIKALPGSPLAEVRRWKKDLRSDPDYRCFIFDYRHPTTRAAAAIETSVFSFDLLDSISVLCANEREQGIMQSHQQTIMSRFLPFNGTPCFQDGRLILATISQLLVECTARVARLKSTNPTHAELKISNMKQKHAKTYRDSQLHIVETATAVCTFVLKSAVRESKASGILEEMQHDLPPAIAQNLQALVGYYATRLTRPSELLTFEGILDMLPKGLSSAVLRCTSELEANLSTQNSQPPPDKATIDKTRFAIVLSALYSELDQGVQLPHRAKSWLDQLSQWYPLDADSWAYVPSLEDEPPPALMSLLAARVSMSPKISTDSSTKQWLRPDRVCWGWNVMEEQVVRVPTRVLQPCGEPVTLEDGPVTIMLYWQQY
ncbi:uncharacterized protein A1O9_05713 [Exophiala aquamarina CBS 119918]|uniref:SET domain-containing protein n=1 Tax=Exophiala aquamarina CBS 119918 TaxID=1182545 RepID=A0A072PEX3_9EURO|nr:uncharacterized protein A1O9_05713 [Exophiala aquamarina CBS 119918]KEF57793.1 hypothetical protein A1O9_05713 [Exophiala aquamarina CBS 119918]